MDVDHMRVQVVVTIDMELDVPREGIYLDEVEDIIGDRLKGTGLRIQGWDIEYMDPDWVLLDEEVDEE